MGHAQGETDGFILALDWAGLFIKVRYVRYLSLGRALPCSTPRLSAVPIGVRCYLYLRVRGFDPKHSRTLSLCALLPAGASLQSSGECASVSAPVALRLLPPASCALYSAIKRGNLSKLGDARSLECLPHLLGPICLSQ